MRARNSILSIVAILVVAAGWPSFVFAGPVIVYGGQFDLPIPANPDDTRGRMDDAIIDVPDHLTIYDIDVAISLTHTSAFDLQIFLQGPSGKKTCLNRYDPFHEFFEGENYIQTVFDDEAPTPIEEAEAPFTGRFRPRAPNLLRLFDGEDAYGTWRLQIHDAHYNDSGVLNSFELMITVPEPATGILLILGAGVVRLFKPWRNR